MSQPVNASESHQGWLASKQCLEELKLAVEAWLFIECISGGREIRKCLINAGSRAAQLS
jgi:hypothetical protein